MNLREKNAAVLKRVLTNSTEAKEMREGFKRRFGFEMTDGVKFPVMKESNATTKEIDVNPDFSFQRLRESLGSKLKEADTSSAFVQLLRAGIQLVVNNMYDVTQTTFDSWVTVVQSKKDTELYAPMFGVGFPSEVARGGKYPEVNSMGGDLKLKNRKWGSMYAAEWELTEDDQTGQIMRNAQLMGEYMKLVIEVVCYGKLASISAGSVYSNITVKPSETQPSYESVWPFAATALQGGGSNRPGTYVLLTSDTIKTAFIALHQQKSPLGLKMEVNPDTILCGPKYEFDAAIIENSAFSPLVGASSAASVGPYAINALKGKFSTIVSKYHFKSSGVVDDGTGTMWYAIDKKKTGGGAFILQMRESASVINEAPNSGMSFETDTLRFKARSRFNADFIEPRFMYRGNDGSVTS